MVFAKKVTKTPAVMVETKKISSKESCGMGCCSKFKHLLMFVLVILNTLMLVCVLVRQGKIEADKVGGNANYKMVQQIYKSETFKAQQAQQIQQALQVYQGGTTAPVVTADQQAQPAVQQVQPAVQQVQPAAQ